MSHTPLTQEQESEAQELAARIREATDEDLLHVARLLVSKRTKELFGQTEFDVRDVVHRIGVKAYELHLAQKKTATKVPASSARTVTKLPSSRTTGRKSR